MARKRNAQLRSTLYEIARQEARTWSKSKRCALEAAIAA
jgi:hypothetical protein